MNVNHFLTGVLHLTLATMSNILATVLPLIYVTSALIIDLESEGFRNVPQDINPKVTELDLDRNEIVRITHISLALYKELLVLSIEYNYVAFIEDGSFDYNSKLEEFNTEGNEIIQLPESFGSAASSLIVLHFWCAIDEPAISKLNFTEMRQLEYLSIGCAKFPGKFNAAILPANLRRINLNYAHLTQCPEFGRYTSNTEKLAIAANNIAEISSKSISGLSALKDIKLKNNDLSNIPDLYHLPLTDLKLSHNPLVATNHCAGFECGLGQRSRL